MAEAAQRRSAAVDGLEVLPRCRVVERRLAGLDRNLRSGKDVETAVASAESRLYLASIQLIIRQIAKA